MLSSATYQLLHILGIMLVFMALGALSLHAMNGGTRDSNRARALVRLGSMGAGLPGWVWVKVVIWLLLAVSIVVPYRKPEWSKAMWFALPILGLIAAYSVLYRPV